MRHKARKHGDHEPIRGKGYPCDECSFVARKKSALKYHKVSDHELKECRQCEFSTESLVAMDKHMKLKSHRGSQYGSYFSTSYPCDKCDYEGNSSTALKYHKGSVHDGIVYSCDFCDYKAKSKQGLKKHVINHH